MNYDNLLIFLNKLLNVLFFPIFLFKKKYILFEGVPPFSGNSGKIYEKLYQDNVFEKYEPIWIINDKSKKRNNIKCIYRNVDKKSIFDFLKIKYYVIQSKLIIYSNIRVLKSRKNQISIFLSHGSPIKSVNDYYRPVIDADYMLIQSNYFLNNYKQIYNIKNNIIPLPFNYPRCDELFLSTNTRDLKKILNINYSKLIAWYPTKRLKDDIYFNTAPFLESKQQAININDIARKYNVLIILKLHHSQENINKDLNLSNIKVLTNKFFEENKISNYEFLKTSDALISDYSSVIYDYLLLDKPIGLTHDDYNEYKKKRGFVVDEEYLFKCGIKINSLTDFEKFVEQISKNIDIKTIERNTINKIINGDYQGNATEKISKFIEKLL